MSAVATLLAISRAGVLAGYSDSRAVNIAYVALLSQAFEAEARRWGDAHGVDIVGNGFEACPKMAP